MRLEKYISDSGVASRRAVKRAIHDGHVTVNGTTITIPGHPIDAETDAIEFHGDKVEPITEHIYLMLNKPSGYLTTRHDERGRPTVMDLLTDQPMSIYPVGRLDLDTEGLLLFTNDGDFAYRMMHPSHEIEKVYHVWVSGIPSKRALNRLRDGVAITGGKTAPAKIVELKVNNSSNYSEDRKTGKTAGVAEYQVIIHEGKKRQVRLMFKAVGHRVIRLKRIQVGSLALGNLPQGKHRYLTPAEVTNLQT